MRSAIALSLTVAAAACGSSPTTQIGGPCASDRTCDDGQICDQTASGGPVCLDVDGDADSDGIVNGKDFCQHIAGGDHDEDLDGIGDECDPCPISKPPAAAESDGDALDSVCDPDTRTPGDKIILFNGFNAPIASAGAAWKIQGGQAVVTPSSPTSIEQLTFSIAGGTSHMAIFAGYRIDAVTAGAAQTDAGVLSRSILPLGTSEVQCGSTRFQGADSVLLAQTDAQGGSTQAIDGVDNAFNAAGAYRVLELIERGMANCAVAADVKENSGATQLNTDGSVPTQVVLFARGATIRFSYVLVVARP